MRIVLDTNVWLDWLLFADPRVAKLKEEVAAKRAVVVIDAACEAELARVLGYAFYKEILPVEAQSAHLAASRAIATKVEVERKENQLPRCADPDDQKFLELALAAGAECLVTRDEALLRLGTRTPFRIVAPEDFAC